MNCTLKHITPHTQVIFSYNNHWWEQWVWKTEFKSTFFKDLGNKITLSKLEWVTVRFIFPYKDDESFSAVGQSMFLPEALIVKNVFLFHTASASWRLETMDLIFFLLLNAWLVAMWVWMFFRYIFFQVRLMVNMKLICVWQMWEKNN